MNKLYLFAFLLIVSVFLSFGIDLVDNQNSRRFVVGPDGLIPSCDDISILETTFQWTVIVEKRLHMEVLAKGLHPLIEVPELSDLARQHSEDGLFGTGSLVDTGRTARRTAILANAFDWLDYSDLTPDPRPAPNVITYIDELYGTGDSPATVWYNMKLAYEDILEKDHQYAGVGIYCDQTDSTSQTYWVTIILIGSCGNASATDLYYKDTSDPEHCFFCSTVESNPTYAECLEDVDTVGGDSVVLLVDTNPDPELVVTEAVCCTWATLNGSNEVPPTDSDFTGQVITTLYLSDATTSLCFQIDHDVPLSPDPDALTAVQVHFGAEDQETESLVLHDVDPSFFSNSIRDCWDFNANGGQTYQSVAKGNFYIHLHNTQSTLSPTYNGIIRAQLGCEAAASLINPDSPDTC